MSIGKHEKRKGAKKMRLKFIARLARQVAALFGICMGLGIIVGKAEKRKGWVEGHKPGFYEKHIKRPLDFGLSLFAILLLWPFMLAVAAAVRINLGKPVLFKQERTGLGGEIFTMQKYRTMQKPLDASGRPLTDEERLNPFGRKLRASSLDELPELFNVLAGDMSMVGPRPLLPAYLPRYSKAQAHRHDVRPGLTGLAQVSGRNRISWEEKFEADVEYD